MGDPNHPQPRKTNKQTKQKANKQNNNNKTKKQETKGKPGIYCVYVTFLLLSTGINFAFTSPVRSKCTLNFDKTVVTIGLAFVFG